MDKTHVYFVPGLAANKKIFKFISLPEELFELHFLDWIIPKSTKEPIEDYAERMCAEISHKNPILVGCSYGGVVAQEMSKLITTKKTIIISSIKTKYELPSRLILAQKTKAYKLFPTKAVENLEDYDILFFNEIFPIKNIKNAIEINNGTHIMILDKAKTISKILEEQCLL